MRSATPSASAHAAPARGGVELDQRTTSIGPDVRVHAGLAVRRARSTTSIRPHSPGNARLRAQCFRKRSLAPLG